jgi:membrane-bound metal-dependent hydrolase YbcI (DUF457 family)
MDFFTHFLIAVLISIFTLNSMPLIIVFYACIMAILPDFDIVLEPLKKIFKSNLLAHKGISHSFFYSALISALLGWIFSLITNQLFLTVWLIGFLFYDLHIFLDFLAASKIPLFYPITKRRFRFFIDRAINFLLALISGSIIIFYIIIFFNWPELFFSRFFYYIVGFYLSYFALRIFIKILVKINYPKSYKYIPGVSPFSYLLYSRIETESTTQFKLILKKLFKNKNRIIIESNLKEDSYNKQLYIKATNLIKKFPFGEKWDAIIPIFEKREDMIVLNLFFAESYSQGRFYSIKIMFNKETNEILELSEGFNRKFLDSKNL